MSTQGKLPRDHDRIDRVCRALHAANIDALVCTLPSNVLLISGYWPIVGNTIAIVTREGAVAMAVPADESEFAADSWAAAIHTFKPGSLDRITNTLESVPPALEQALKSLALTGSPRIAVDGSGSYDPSTYASSFIYGPAIETLLHSAIPSAQLSSAYQMLAALRSTLTTREIGHVRRACCIARDAFQTLPIAEGDREFDVAARLRRRLIDPPRRDGFAYCMSGPNSAKAYAAFQHTSCREIQAGDFVLVHCNSYCGGFWTDITRTFSIHHRETKQDAILEAVLAASRAALAAVRPGVRASEVDRAARDILTERGFGKEFKHATGHGVGFAAINHDARPHIHPVSSEILEPGMIFNVEPAVYIDGVYGLRQCNMVLVTDSACELLTDFQNTPDELLR
jgi:Xaa-Pro aminopeptidase